jgi:subtilisin
MKRRRERAHKTGIFDRADAVLGLGLSQQSRRFVPGMTFELLHGVNLSVAGEFMKLALLNWFLNPNESGCVAKFVDLVRPPWNRNRVEATSSSIARFRFHTARGVTEMSVQSTLNAVGVVQVIVTLREVPPGNGAAMAAAKPDLGKVTKHFRRSEDSPSGAVALAAGRRSPPSPVKIYRNLGLMLGTVDKKGYQGLKKEPSVKAVNEAPQMSLIKPVAATVATAVKGPTWGIKRLQVDKLWAQGFIGTGVLIGHLDTGVDGKHPAFKGGAIAKFAEFDDLGELVPGAKAHDSDEHGTHTAGTIAGRPVKGSRFGVAPGAQLASAMVIEGGDIIARILGGMDWIIGEGARILSMSLGLRGFHAEFLPLMQAIRNRGILPVMAVGNEGPGTSRSPGNYDIVLSVGASDDQDEVADFSSSQTFIRPDDPLVPDLVGPGVDTLSSLPGGKFGEFSGTSMATPHIAGLAALLWQAKPGATVDEIEAAIFGSCTRPATMPEARANRGIPDAVEALAILQGSSSAGKAKKGEKRKSKVAKKK